MHPIITIVFIAGLSFWINRAAVPARIAIVITYFLVIITQFGHQFAALPPLDGEVPLAACVA